MRKLFGLVVVALLAATLPAAATQLAGHRASLPKVAPTLERSLDVAGDTPLMVFVHGTSLTAARAAVATAGLDKLGEWTSIDVVVAGGTPAKVRSVIGAPGVTYVEPNTPISFDSDTARVATRTIEAQARTWPVTTTATPTGKKPCNPNRPAKKPCPPTTTTRQVGPFTGAGRSIAIVDSGIDGTHPMFQRPDGTSKVVKNQKLLCLDHAPVYFTDLAGMGNFPPGTCPADPATQDQLWVDFTDTTNDTDTVSVGGHGTHVASIAAGEPVTAMDRELGGTAPDADLVGLSIGATLSIYGADTALDWITRHHAHPCGDTVPVAACPPITVVNNSYGPTGGGDFDPQSATTKLQDVLVSEGIAVVWANGNGDELNDGGNGSDNRSNPPGQDPTPGVISVANYDDFNQGTRDGALDSSSSRGQAGSPETYPDVSAPGSNITAACRPYLAICSTNFESDPNYGTISGTSMASPHTAGIVATLQQAMEAAGQTPSPGAIENILEDTAHKFTFGAAYEPDLADRNADNTTSFDKGHGLVDTYNAISSVFGVAPSEPTGGAQCDPAATGFTDERGDANRIALPENDAAYDPRLDILGLTVTGDPTAETISFRFDYAEVDGSDPSASPAMSTDLDFSIGAVAHTADLFRSASAGQATGSVDSTDATVVVDEAANSIMVSAPRTALGDVAGPVTLVGLHAFTRRDTGVVLAPVADEAGGPCPVTVDVGGTVAPPPDPDPSTYAAKLVPGDTYAWEGTPPVPVNPAPTGDTECVTFDDPRCEATGLWISFTGGSATLSITLNFPDGDDFDMHLFGPDGTLIDSGAGSDNPEVINATLTAPGVYHVSVAAFLSTGESYSATASLS